MNLQPQDRRFEPAPGRSSFLVVLFDLSLGPLFFLPGSSLSFCSFFFFLLVLGRVSPGGNERDGSGCVFRPCCLLRVITPFEVESHTVVHVSGVVDDAENNYGAIRIVPRVSATPLPLDQRRMNRSTLLHRGTICRGPGGSGGGPTSSSSDEPAKNSTVGRCTEETTTGAGLIYSCIVYSCFVGGRGAAY